MCHQHKLAIPFYHPCKTFNFSDKGISIFSVWKPQMKLELKGSRDIHWKKFWITEVLTGLFNCCKFFVLVSATIGFCFPKGLDLAPGPVSRRCIWEDVNYYFFSPQWLGGLPGLQKGELIQNYNSAVHTT